MVSAGGQLKFRTAELGALLEGGAHQGNTTCCRSPFTPGGGVGLIDSGLDPPAVGWLIKHHRTSSAPGVACSCPWRGHRISASGYAMTFFDQAKAGVHGDRCWL